VLRVKLGFGLLAAPHDPCRDDDAGNNQDRGRDDERDLENRLRPARGIAERRREADLERRQPAVHLIDAREDRLEVRRLGVARHNAPVQLLRERVELGDVLVRFRPDGDRPAHEAHLAEAAEEHDHAVDVGRIVLAYEEAFARNCNVGLGLLELEPRLAVAKRHRDGIAVVAIVGLGSRLRVAKEAVDRFFLRFGPEALAADVGARGRHDPQAFGGQQHYRDDDHEERPGDAEQPFARRSPHGCFRNLGHCHRGFPGSAWRRERHVPPRLLGCIISKIRGVPLVRCPRR